jgi:hypothetical protein
MRKNFKIKMAISKYAERMHKNSFSEHIYQEMRRALTIHTCPYAQQELKKLNDAYLPPKLKYLLCISAPKSLSGV